MRRVLIIITICVAIASLLGATVVMAAPSGKDSPANKNPNNLYLYPKDPPADPAAPEWDPQWGDDAWGKFNFKINGPMISGVFNGHGLAGTTDYSLISYNDPWDASPVALVVIGEGTADGDGDVHISVNTPVDLGTDVASPDYSTSGGSCPGDGYKIWLVPSGDLNAAGDAFDNVWNPDDYLFENNRIGATATFPCP